MEGLKNELDDLIEPFQLSLVIYGGKIMYLDIFSYSMFPFGKSCCWSQQKILWGECLSVIAIKCDCRYSCYRPLLLYQAVKCLGWQRQLSNNFSTDFKWGSPRSCEVTGRSMLRGTMPPVAEKLSFQPCWHDLLLLVPLSWRASTAVLPRQGKTPYSLCERCSVTVKIKCAIENRWICGKGRVTWEDDNY